MKYILPILIVFLNTILSVYLFYKDTCILNTGIAFGIRIHLEPIFSLLILGVLIYIAKRVSDSMKIYLFSIVILGFGNLFVRVIYGYICDYISIFNISFNIVDIGIVLYVFLSILGLLKGYRGV